MYSSLTFLLSALLIGAVGVDSDNGVSYTVSQIVEVRHPEIVVCRLRDYRPATRVRFKVRLRGVEAVDDPDLKSKARQFLAEQLAQANHIQLRRVKDHGYFHLTAEIYADQTNLGEQLLQSGWVKSLPPSTEPDTLEPDVPIWEGLPLVAESQQEGLWPAASTERPDNRLGRDADLSRIGPDTSLAEALRIISAQSIPPLPILVMWGDLEQNAFVTRHSPVGIEGLGKMRAEKALRLVLLGVSPTGVPLRMIPGGGILTIGTNDSNIATHRAVVYPVADILSTHPRNFRYR